MLIVVIWYIFGFACNVTKEIYIYNVTKEIHIYTYTTFYFSAPNFCLVPFYNFQLFFDTCVCWDTVLFVSFRSLFMISFKFKICLIRPIFASPVTVPIHLFFLQMGHTFLLLWIPHNFLLKSGPFEYKKLAALKIRFVSLPSVCCHSCCELLLFSEF